MFAMQRHALGSRPAQNEGAAVEIEPCELLPSSTQRLHHPLIKEYTLKHSRDP